jgi:hypothetical protein
MREDEKVKKRRVCACEDDEETRGRRGAKEKG